MNLKNLNKALGKAAALGQLEQCKRYLRHGADVNAPDEDDDANRTPLHRAAENGSADICRTLIEYGADVNALDSGDATPLHLAAEAGHVETCRLLKGCGAKVHALDNMGRTPFHGAVMIGNVDAAAFFLEECGEDANQRTNDNRTLDELATDWGSPNMAEFLTKYRNALRLENSIRNSLEVDGAADRQPRSKGCSPL